MKLIGDRITIETTSGPVTGTIASRRNGKIMVCVSPTELPANAEGFTQSGKNWVIWIDEKEAKE